MTTFVLIAMALLLIAALERTNRRQTPRPPGLNGANDRNDRDWARTKLELLAIGDRAEPFAHKPVGVTHPARESGSGTTTRSPKPERQHWNTNHRNGPRPA